MTSSTDQNIIDGIKEFKELEPYFFKKIIDKKDIKWINILKENGYFEDIPVLRDGAYIEKWDVLEYIKAVINEAIENDLLLDDILTLLNKTALSTNNFRVFNQVIDILTKIPTKKYTDKYISNIMEGCYNNIIELNFIVRELVDELLKNIINTDINKSVIVLSSVIKMILNSKENINYMIIDIFNNNEYIIDEIINKKYDDFIDNVIRSCEAYLCNQNVKRTFENHVFEITYEDEMLNMLCDKENILSKRLENRKKDVEEIILNINKKVIGLSYGNVDRISKLLYGDLFKKGSLNSIFNQEGYIYDKDEFIIIMFKKIMDREQEVGQYINTTNKMINSNYDFIIRLGLYFISKINTEAIEEIIINNKDVFDYVIRFYIFDEEIKFVLAKLENIGPDILEYLKLTIDKLEYINHNFGDDFLIQWKQKRYKALINIPDFESKYLECLEKTKIDVELKSHFNVSGGSISEKSPYTEDEIKNMTNEELILNMMKFIPDKSYNSNWERISYEGFGNKIKSVVMEIPSRFISNLEKFEKVDYSFILYIIEGFSDLIKDKKIKNIESILMFFKDYISKQEFWENKYSYNENRHVNYESVLKAIFRSISLYLQNDKLDLDKISYDAILNLSQICFDKMKYDKYEEDIKNSTDYSHDELNSLIHIISMILLELSLKIKRTNVFVDMDNWNNDIKPIYEVCLNEAPYNMNLFIGYSTSYLTYIDKEWINSKLIREKGDYAGESIKYFIAGYLLDRNVYKDYFDIMKQKYVIALDSEFNDKTIKKNLAEHLMIAYINGFDDNNELINKFMESADSDMMINAIRICKVENVMEDINREELKERVIYLWGSIIQKYEDGCNFNCKVIENTISLKQYFNELNQDVIDYLNKSIKYLSEQFFANNLILYVSKYAKESQEEKLEELVVNVLNKLTPTYPEKEVKILIEYLIDRGREKELKDILQSYILNGKKDSFVVTDIYSNFKNRKL